jgi:transketolase
MNAKEIRAPRLAYGETLVKLGAELDNLVVLDADLAHATMTTLFRGQFPERFFNVGIAEQNMMGIASGLALAGFMPFASTFAVFGAGRAFEQVRNTICYPRLNVKIAVTHAGITVGEDGGSHQSVEDISLMRSIPNMTVMVPADAVETEKAVRAAAAFDGPVYLRIPRPPAPVFIEAGTKFEIGKADILRDGRDVCLCATGLMVFQAVQAAEQLHAAGIEATVVNFHTIKPIDERLIIELAQRVGKMITVEEHSIIGGLGSAVAEVLSEHRPVYLKRIGIQDRFGQSGAPDQLLEAYGLTAANIVGAAKTLLARQAE